MERVWLAVQCLACLVLLGMTMACAWPAQAAPQRMGPPGLAGVLQGARPDVASLTPTVLPTPTPSPPSGVPLNPPCWQYPPGIVIGTPTPTPPPSGTPSPSPSGTPTLTPTATPTATPTPALPACQWPQDSGSSCNGWHLSLPLGIDWCIPWKDWLTQIMQAFAEALGSAAQGVFDWVQGALTYTPDLTSYPDLATLYGSMRQLGSALFIGFFMLAALRYLLTTIGNDNAYEALGAMRRGVLGVIFLQALDPLLHLWFTGVNDLALAINNAPPDSNVGAFAADVLGLNSLIVGTAGLIAPEVLVAAILLAAVFLVLITVITVVRLSGLFVLACLYVIAPVCLVTWVSPEFKAIARWWFASFVTYSLWGVAYALVLKVDIVLLTGNGGPPNDGTAAGKAVISALMGLAGLTALWRVPRIMDSLLGGLASPDAGTAIVSSGTMRYIGRKLQ